MHTLRVSAERVARVKGRKPPMTPPMPLPNHLFASFWKNRTLIARLVVRDIHARYRGTLLGLAWAVGVPLATVLIYLFVFMHVLAVRWDGGSGTKAEYALILFAGLIVFNFFAECVNRAPGLMLEDITYIKRVVFPLEVLPWVCLAVALFHALVSACILLACHLVLIGSFPATALLAPLACLPLAFFSLGVMWFLASLGVYLRDLKLMVGVATTFLLFLSPVFYPLSAAQGWARTLLRCNPLTQVLENVRGGLFFGTPPEWPDFAWAFVASLLVSWLGYAWFMKTKPGFADVV